MPSKIINCHCQEVYFNIIGAGADKDGLTGAGGGSRQPVVVFSSSSPEPDHPLLSLLSSLYFRFTKVM